MMENVPSAPAVAVRVFSVTPDPGTKESGPSSPGSKLKPRTVTSELGRAHVGNISMCGAAVSGGGGTKPPEGHGVITSTTWNVTVSSCVMMSGRANPEGFESTGDGAARP